MSVPDPVQASAEAVRSRRARAEVKQAIAAGERTPLEVCETAWSDATSAESSLLASELLSSLRGLGPLRTDQTLEELGISRRRRLRGLGVHQRDRLRHWLRERPGTDRPNLVVLAGPTAVGKGTVAQFIRDRYPQIKHAVSATTRSIRPGEIDGVHYRFVSDAEFDAMIEHGEFLEWATVHNAYRYGTPKSSVDEQLSRGNSVLLEIDLQGARAVRDAMPEALTIFLAPPSWDELVRRLVGRGTETEEERARRLRTAEVELASQHEFDHVVVNHDVAEAAHRVVELLRGDVS
ncbi:guanylate kinase [uncultured Agrococcus sp.]|uniref:guanylate kinase n=1 Tax=uncultured Agrococcus sp. TaxID=382258 RepID=UPI0025FA2F89|nr:guanylate kinase [uncultured Agrococcus sp.]